MKKGMNIGFIIGAIAVLALAGYFGYQRSQNKIPRVQQMDVIPVETVTVQQQSIPHTLQALGQLLALQQIDISPQDDGHIKSILFKDGGYVTKDQIIVLMSDAEVKAELKSSQSALALAKLQYGRLQQLGKHSAVSLDQLDQAKNTYLQAKAQVEQDETKVKYTILKAPFSGYLGARAIDQGQFIKAGTAIVTLVDSHQVKATYQIPVQFMPELQVGQVVNATVDAYPNTVFHGQVSFIAPFVDDATRTVQVEALIPNEDKKLSPGMFVKIEQVTGVNHNAMIVPIACLVPAITGAFVYKVVNGRAIMTPVTTGVYWDKYVEILSGLNVGDNIVMTGQQRLRDGLQVKVVPNTWQGLAK